MSTTNERIQLGELVCWRIRHAGAELLVSEQGAQILRYQPAGQQPLIWLSEQAAYQAGQSVRGGVPVCWPWFGDLQRNPEAIRDSHMRPENAPAHGLVRNCAWQLLGLDTREDGIRLSFGFDTAEQPFAEWPFAAELQLDIHLGERLSLSLSTRNLGDTQLPLSQALHSYFAVSDIRQVQVEGLDACRYIDTLEDWQARQQRGSLAFTGETDRIYLDTPAQLSIVDPQWKRRILMRSEGSHSAVVWNPWTDKARRLSQFADDAWQGMLCIEHANVLDDALMLAPDAEYRLAVSLWTQTL
ncbi:D-hexose-6-phosphate mutarotase [Phytopseudomonas dryadis]|uniref:Putative glucose-6-phosphate 1-epimerase n=1 Tax=Phytopseudomonas dryadis TaxID=2487520 RepID=A0A4Q9R2I1_9GAMM|nr:MULTISPECIES: D-hexose-6-phosphate mutarotase [Pseudomonas]TBU92522.1 D-hexose-6-phosphate mutarotase [Pseudomonas dryadis]TBV03064.1 D-hexose-6-phosphate mutarotase [Pseudomonas dryadis]TBV17659.1 D-hexose-6-phosphate mutarotase [Pseudomonas sp. FRB 230]